jgi:Trk K+ transport system NAD-binding subunit
LTVIAIAMSMSFAIAAPLNSNAHQFYTRYRTSWRRLQESERLDDDRPLNLEGATIAIFGMGGIGTGAYDKMRALYGETVVGVDIDPATVKNQRETGRNVLLGDPSDADFWDRVQAGHTLELAMLALPNLNTNLAVLEQLQSAKFAGQIAVTAKFQDETDILKRAGATTVFNIYTEAGAGFASHIVDQGTEFIRS